MGALQIICQRTDEFISAMPREQRKEYGQFFTGMQTARFMASMFELPGTGRSTLRVLDAGAGSGILAAALVERIMNETDCCVRLMCYENDPNILSLLAENLLQLAATYNNRFDYKIYRQNYVLADGKEECDLIIGNPPYKKISKDAPEALAMPQVCYGAPNLYFLFMATGVSQLREGSQLVYIIPRSWTSGAYFQRFRQFLFQNCVLEHIHLFESRDKVFDKESVLQETMIVKVRKNLQKPEKVLITSTPTSKAFDALQCVEAPYDTVVSGRQQYVFLTTSNEEMENLHRLNALCHTLPDLGLRMKTGLVVDFRSREYLRQEQSGDTIPLIYSTHIRDGRVSFPAGRDNEYLCTDKQGLIQRNKNYLFLKRFTAKEEPRRLQCGVYLKRNLPDYQYISSQNKVNFVDSDGELSECIVFGLYVLFNSRSYDLYYRILNGSTQVNSTEMNNMPVPDLATIERMGKEMISTRDMSVTNCDRILNTYIA